MQKKYWSGVLALLVGLLALSHTPSYAQYGLCHRAFLPVRAETNAQSEQVTQLIFGEAFQVLKTDSATGWVWIKNHFDGYEGWIPQTDFAPISKAYYEEYKVKAHPLSADRQGRVWIGKLPLSLPQGSVLPFYEAGRIRVGDQKYRFEGKIIPTQNRPKPAAWIQTARTYLGVPYQWGGKTEQGLDCSGFTQMVLRQNGRALPRDSYQQAEVGQKITLAEARPGDLAFFQRKAEGEGKVVHVGIYLGQGQLIHADGMVRINRLDDTGIYRDDLGKYSHYLKFLRRVE